MSERYQIKLKGCPILKYSFLLQHYYLLFIIYCSPNYLLKLKTLTKYILLLPCLALVSTFNFLFLVFMYSFLKSYFFPLFFTFSIFLKVQVYLAHFWQRNFSQKLDKLFSNRHKTFTLVFSNFWLNQSKNLYFF